MDVSDPRLKDKGTITDLPEELILVIAAFLEVQDLIRFSHSFRKGFHVCNSSDHLWKKHFAMSGFSESKILTDAAENMVGQGVNFINILRAAFFI